MKNISSKTSRFTYTNRKTWSEDLTNFYYMQPTMEKNYQNQLRSRQNDIEIRNVKTLSLILFKSNFIKIFI